MDVSVDEKQSWVYTASCLSVGRGFNSLLNEDKWYRKWLDGVLCTYSISAEVTPHWTNMIFWKKRLQYYIYRCTTARYFSLPSVCPLQCAVFASGLNKLCDFSYSGKVHFHFFFSQQISLPYTKSFWVLEIRALLMPAKLSDITLNRLILHKSWSLNGQAVETF